MIWPEEELESLRKKLNDININHLEESEKKDHDKDLETIKDFHIRSLQNANPIKKHEFNKEGLEIPLMHDLSMTCLYDMA